MAEFNASAAELENKLHQRTNEVKLMQSELKIVKEFRRCHTWIYLFIHVFAILIQSDIGYAGLNL